MFKRTQVAYGVLAALGGALIAVGNPALAQQATERVVVTGSRILKSDLQSSSPMTTVTAAELVGKQDITLDTALNVLPQVNPAGTTSSNNPGNSGQSNIDLRGLGANRNLVLIDGRRAMVSASNQTVDLNTIPLALIDSIEVITGGAGAVYGADAVAGIVNVKLKRRFSGLNIQGGVSNATEKRDAREQSFGILGGANFEGGRGNAVINFDYAERQQLIKNQRSFAAVATATTSFFPEGLYLPTGNAPTQSAVDGLYGQASYGGAPAGTVPASSNHSFNLDGTLIYPGIFNSPRDVLNWRYPVDSGVNTNLFPDVYSYNFDAVNILILPVERFSVGAKLEYNLTDKLEFFARASNTQYASKTALAPTPVSTVTVAATGSASPTQASSPFVVPGQNVATNLVIPTTNPFIPADLRVLLNSRSSDNPAIVGSGPTEPFLYRWRTLGAGLREANYTNEVTQAVVGLRGELFNTGWTWDAYVSGGETIITNNQKGNIDTNRLLATLAASDGGASLCSGGVNPFGRQPLSASCAAYLTVDNTITTTFSQKIAQAFVTGDIAKLPAGGLASVFGVELRDFNYALDPGSAAGPISGFNVQNRAVGKNSFRDIFAEFQLPLARRAAFAQSLDLSLAMRTSQSESQDKVRNLKSDSERSNTFALNLTWQPTNALRARGSLQRSVRAPNFGELFDGGTSAPQYYDPCSVTSAARRGPNATQLTSLCQTNGASGGLGAAVSTYVQTPGTQATIVLGGNPTLEPETADTATLGLVWASRDTGLRASIDYYRIDVKDAITTPDTNEIIADCYNFYGRNPTYSASNSSCGGIARAGGNIVQVSSSAPGGVFANTNGGRITTDGLDIELGWGGSLGPGKMDVGLNFNYLLSYDLKTANFLPSKDFVGTIPYFGAGLGQAFPKYKGVLRFGYEISGVSADVRVRFFDKMKNRMELMFPGERFTGTPATSYLDIAAGWQFYKGMTIRAGLNNVLDQEPRTYAPNVQSGTDPSTFDVIGRRFFVQANVQF
jgi:iron complex outermembrane recepter protein